MRSERAVGAGVLLSIAFSLASAAPAPAPATSDDVRCLLLSAGYARSASSEASRRGAAMTGAFFLGRLSGRLSTATLDDAIRTQGSGLPSKEAEPLMRACAARAATAEQTMAAAIQAAQRAR